MGRSPIKILFVIPSLKAGGAERVISYLKKSIDPKRYVSKLVVVGYEKESVFHYGIDNIIFLNKRRVQHSFFSVLKHIIVYKPNIVFSAIAHLNIMIGLQSLLFPKIKFIGREVNIKSVVKNYSHSKRKKGIWGRLLSKIGYSQLDKIICQSQDMANDLINNYSFPSSKIVIINNPIPDRLIPKIEIPKIKTSGYNLITVGRLVKQKGHHRIIEALAELQLPYIYTIIGDGPEKENIMDYSKKLGVFDKIIHINFTSEVFNYLSESHLFLQGSYVEGFPNVLLESCAIGTPVIAYKAPGGIDEIIEPGINGFIVNNKTECIFRINQILNGLEYWRPANISKSVYSKYSSDQVLKKYETLFQQILK